MNGKEDFGIGFKNNSDCFDIRNSYFEASSSPKDITTLNNEAKEAFVFEGFTDFLSFMAVHNQADREYKFKATNHFS